MAGARTGSKGKKEKPAAAPPPPPPTLIRVDTPETFKTHVTDFPGSALLAVVSPLNSASTTAILPFLEKLNESRPPLLKDTKLLVLYAVTANRALCQQLQVSTVPCFFSYSYGEIVSQFSGDNTAKVELLAKLAAQKCEEDTAARLQAAAAAAEEAAAANGAEHGDGSSAQAVAAA